MRWSRFYLFTEREAPKDAEVISHQLMVRAGLIRKVASGIYSTLPLGQRSVAKLMNIVRQGMEDAGSVELAMPAVQPAELWQESGRWQQYGKELLRISDRHERDFCFGPTHEEVITDIVRRDIKSYRQLPVNLYQIQTKFRDEIRPRFGLMRGREFIMKDAYSFHADEESLEESYQAMRAAYCQIFEACHLDYTMVEADSGAIGGSSSHEFMVLAETGEDAVVRCLECGYAANVEKAGTQGVAAAADAELEELKEVQTPGATSVPEVAALLGVGEERLVKTLIYRTDDGPVAVLVRGDREVNEVKLAHALEVQEVELADDELVRQATGAPVGFAGPVGLPDGFKVIADHTASELTNFACGANAADLHLTGVNWERDAPRPESSDLLLVRGGDSCPVCGSQLAQARGIEVGHIFKLGTKYSDSMGATFNPEDGSQKPMPMGCYGLGIGRTLAAAIEQNHDENGIVWPLPLAPFEVLLVSLDPKDPEVQAVAERLYNELREKKIEVLFDDRQERPGVKFKDADLIGIPVRLVVGAKSLKEDKVELSLRKDRERMYAAPSHAVEKVVDLVLAG